MAGIRKAEVRTPQQTGQTGRVGGATKGADGQAQALSAAEISQLLAKAFGNHELHGNELPKIADALARAGALKGDLTQNLERRLADPNLKVSAESLNKLAVLGVNVTVARGHLEARTDLKTTRNLGQTDVKSVAEAVVGEKASDNLLGKQAAIHASHAGSAVAKNELSPEYKLAKQLVGDVAGRIYSDKAPPEMKAVVDAVGPNVSALAQQTAFSVMQDPNAMANIGGLVAKFGKEGFSEALKTSTKGISEHFLKTAGVQAKNPEAIKAALSGIEAMAPKMGHKLGPKIADTAAKLGPRLLGEGAEIGAKTAAAGAKGAAQAGATVGAKVGAKTAIKAGGQALPIIGNVISVGSTLLAGANLISQLAKKPHDVEKILKEGINTLTQGVGIAFPWVGLGGTLVDAAWGAKVGVSDEKKAAQGIPVTENANIAAAMPLLGDSAEILQAALKGAGKADAAEKVGQLAATTRTMATLDLNNPGERIKLLRKDEQEALIALAHESRSDLEAMAKDAEPGSQKEALVRLAGGFGALADTTLATMRFDKREDTPGFDDKARKDLVTKRNELAGKLVGQLSELGLAKLAASSPQR